MPEPGRSLKTIPAARSIVGALHDARPAITPEELDQAYTLLHACCLALANETSPADIKALLDLAKRGHRKHIGAIIEAIEAADMPDVDRIGIFGAFRMMTVFLADGRSDKSIPTA